MSLANHEGDLTVNAEQLQFLAVGEGAESRRIAFRQRAPAAPGAPGLVWMGGFKSDMLSTKASALDAFCAGESRAFLRFDYSGHGESGGDFLDGTIGRWLEESLAVFRAQTEGPQIVVGSSMGGYLALLLARALHAAGEGPRLAGLALIAPAVDFTEALIWAHATPEMRAAIERDGFWQVPSAYAPQPYVFTRKLIEDGRRHLLFGGVIRSHAPARILQGMQDRDVPYAHALKLIEHMPSDPVTLTLIRDGDHRLSRPQDLDLLFAAIQSLDAAG